MCSNVLLHTIFKSVALFMKLAGILRPSCDMNIGLHPEQDKSTSHHQTVALQSQV